MSKQPSFEVRSGHLCFGALHNIYHGAITSPVNGFPPMPPSGFGGTVKRWEIEYNIPALAGTWLVYPLSSKGKVNAYIVCHSSVDAKAELLRILRIAGSPYEYESGSRFNNPQTSREGIFIVNRYDWDNYDRRSQDVVQDVGGQGIDSTLSPEFCPYSSVGLVDRDAAKDAVRSWQGQRSDQRDILFEDKGTWLHVFPAEYCFGRFGFDEAKEHAKSFLFFNIGTIFFETTFPGDTSTIRKPETKFEIFERRLKDNFNFTGLPGFWEDWENWPPPPSNELFGPYEAHEYILTDDDMDAIFKTLPRPVSDISPEPFLRELDDKGKTALKHWWSESVAVLNEYVLTFLQRSIISKKIDISSAAAWETASATLFDTSMRAETARRRLEDDVKSRFLYDPEQSEPNDSLPRRDSVLVRLRHNFSKHSVEAHKDALHNLCEILIFVLAEVLEIARGFSIDNSRFGLLVPSDVRGSVMLSTWWDNNNFKYSRVLWHGR